MGLFSRIAGTTEARANNRAARENLERVAGGREETPEYVAANRAVIESEKALPKWRRGPGAR